MVSRENRAILGSFLCFAVVFAAILVAETQFGLRLTEGPLVAFLLYAGLAIAVPQLYLAATDTDVSPRSRVRFTAVVSLVFAGMLTDGTDRLQDLAVLTIAGVAFVGLVGYEFLAGYRDSRAGSH